VEKVAFAPLRPARRVLAQTTRVGVAATLKVDDPSWLFVATRYMSTASVPAINSPSGAFIVMNTVRPLLSDPAVSKWAPDSLTSALRKSACRRSARPCGRTHDPEGLVLDVNAFWRTVANLPGTATDSTPSSVMIVAVSGSFVTSQARCARRRASSAVTADSVIVPSPLAGVNPSRDGGTLKCDVTNFSRNSSNAGRYRSSDVFWSRGLNPFGNVWTR